MGRNVCARTVIFPKLGGLAFSCAVLDDWSVLIPASSSVRLLGCMGMGVGDGEARRRLSASAAAWIICTGDTHTKVPW